MLTWCPPSKNHLDNGAELLLETQPHTQLLLELWCRSDGRNALPELRLYEGGQLVASSNDVLTWHRIEDVYPRSQWPRQIYVGQPHEPREAVPDIVDAVIADYMNEAASLREMNVVGDLIVEDHYLAGDVVEWVKIAVENAMLAQPETPHIDIASMPIDVAAHLIAVATYHGLNSLAYEEAGFNHPWLLGLAKIPLSHVEPGFTYETRLNAGMSLARAIGSDQGSALGMVGYRLAKYLMRPDVELLEHVAALAIELVQVEFEPQVWARALWETSLVLIGQAVQREYGGIGKGRPSAREIAAREVVSSLVKMAHRHYGRSMPECERAFGVSRMWIARQLGEQ